MVSSRNESVFLMNKFWHVTIPTLTTPLDTCLQEMSPPFLMPFPSTLEQITSFDQLLVHATLQEAACLLFPLKASRCSAALKSSFLEYLSILLLRLRLKSRDLYGHSL